MTLQEYQDYLAKVFSRPTLNPCVEIVPLTEGEAGYHEFKMLDKDGKIVGYCGQSYLDAINKYFDGNEPKQDKLSIPPSRPHPLIDPKSNQ